MGVELLLQGMVVGFLASVALGPVTVMCIQRTLSRPSPSGLVSGLGAAAGDTFFAILTWFFVTIITPFIEAHKNLITIAFGACVLIVGLVFFFRNPVKQIRRDRMGKIALWSDFLSTFALTLSNPIFILWQLVIFSVVGSSAGRSTGAEAVWVGVPVILGYFCGAMVWWSLLVGLVGRLRGRFDFRHLVQINRVAGAAIAVLGVGTVISTFVWL